MKLSREIGRIGSVLSRLDYILGREARPDAIVLLTLMAVGAALEALGIGMVLPLVALIAEPGAIDRYPELKTSLAALNLSSTEELLIASASGLMFVFVFKNTYLAWMYNKQFRFVYNNFTAVTERLLQAYLYAPYTFHVDSNSSDLVRNLTIEMNNVFNRFVIPIFSFAVELLVVGVVGLLLFTIDPLATITALAVLGGVGALFYILVRRKILEYGQRQQKHASLMIRWINQGIGGIKESKVRGVERFFLDRFGASTDAYASSARAARFLQLTPRFFIETLAVGGILAVLTALLVGGRQLSEIVAVLGVFGLAAVRLMPSVTRIISSLTAIRNSIPALDVVYGDLHRLENPTPDESMTPSSCGVFDFHESLEVRNVVFQYPTADAPTLRGLSFKIRHGESVAFVGSSGSGKTTTVDVLLGLLPPKSGEVFVDGRSVFDNLGLWLRKVGYIAQPVYLLDDTVRRNVTYGLPGDEDVEDRVWQALESARLAGHVRSLPNGLDTVVGENGARLSGGQRQRIGIARALFRSPEVLILDEATSALDNRTESEIVQTISELKGKKTLITIAHRLSTVRSCDRIFFMADGEIDAVGTFDELLATNTRFRDLTQVGGG